MKIHARIVVSFCLFAFSYLVLPAIGMSPMGVGVQSENDPIAPGSVSENEQDRPSEDVLPTKVRPDTEFLRLQTDEYENPIALQTATVKYVLKNEQGDVQLEVFLEGVVHIADTSYYRGFQQRFERYDSVLCESVVKQEKKESSRSGKLSGLNMLQQLSSGTLGLTYQYDEIDYDAGNLIHADLSTQERSDLMKARGDDQVTLMADLLAHIIKKMNVGGNEAGTEENELDAQVDEESEPNSEPKRSFTIDLKVLTDPNGIMKIRRMMASVLVDSKLLESIFPPSIHKLMIGDRNDRVMSFLEKERAEGKRRIAIFFGVGHMPDLEERLITQYGMELQSVNWRNAWDLRDGSIEGAPLEGLVESAFRDSFKNKMRQFARDLRSKDPSDESDAVGESEKNKKIDDLEKTLKALEAKLKQMEEQGKEDKAPSPPK